MHSQTRSTAPVSKRTLWISWSLSVILALMLLMSGVMKFIQPPEAAKELERLGLASKTLVPLGVVEILCTLLYLWPRTSILGAILLTGYLGGAIATHVRVSDPFWIPLGLGVLLWIALWLREPRLRSLAPLCSRTRS